MGGCIVYTGIRLVLFICPFISSLFFLSKFRTNIFQPTFLRNCEAYKVETLYTRGQWVVVSYTPESDCCSYLSLYCVMFISLQISNINFFPHTFLRTAKTKLGIHMDNGGCMVHAGIRLLLLIRPLFLQFSFSPIFKHKIFVTLKISQELWGLHSWNFIYTWWIYHVYSIQTAWKRGLYWICLVLPWFCDFGFCNAFRWKISSHFCPGTVSRTKLKFGGQVGYGWLSRVYRNQAAAIFSSLHFFTFCLQISNIKMFVTLFSETVCSIRLTLGIHMDNWWFYLVYRNQAAAAAYLYIYFFIFLSLQSSNIKKESVTLFSGTVRPT